MLHTSMNGWGEVSWDETTSGAKYHKDPAVDFSQMPNLAMPAIPKSHILIEVWDSSLNKMF
jgi:hypothetical protein